MDRDNTKRVDRSDPEFCSGAGCWASGAGFRWKGSCPVGVARPGLADAAGVWVGICSRIFFPKTVKNSPYFNADRSRILKGANLLKPSSGSLRDVARCCPFLEGVQHHEQFFGTFICVVIDWHFANGTRSTKRPEILSLALAKPRHNLAVPSHSRPPVHCLATPFLAKHCQSPPNYFFCSVHSATLNVPNGPPFSGLKSPMPICSPPSVRSF